MLRLISQAGRGGTILPASGGGGRRPRALRAGGGVGGGVASRPPCSASGGRPAVPYPGPPLVVGALFPGVRVWLGSGSRPGGGGMRGGPWTAPPVAPSDLNPPSGLPEWAMVRGGVMGGAAPILFWCAAVRRPKARSARRSSALVWVGGRRLGALGRALCRSSRTPTPPASRSLLGERGRPLGSGGAEFRPCGPQAGGGGGGGEGLGGGAQPAPAPPPRRESALHLCSPAGPPGVYSSRGGCRAAAGVGRGQVGGQWVSAVGGGEREGEPPRPGSPPCLPQAGL